MWFCLANASDSVMYTTDRSDYVRFVRFVEIILSSLQFFMKIAFF